MSGSVESGRPTPTRTRWKSGEPRSRLSDLSPLWPASPPPRRTRTSPNGRSISSWMTSRRSRSSLNEPRAGPTGRLLGAGELERDRGVDLLGHVDPQEVDMQGVAADGVALEVLDEHGLALSP